MGRKSEQSQKEGENNWRRLRGEQYTGATTAKRSTGRKAGRQIGRRTGRRTGRERIGDNVSSRESCCSLHRHHQTTGTTGTHECAYIWSGILICTGLCRPHCQGHGRQQLPQPWIGHYCQSRLVMVHQVVCNIGGRPMRRQLFGHVVDAVKEHRPQIVQRWGAYPIWCQPLPFDQWKGRFVSSICWQGRWNECLFGFGVRGRRQSWNRRTKNIDGSCGGHDGGGHDGFTQRWFGSIGTFGV